jgi:hypothetical protein
LKIQFAHKFQLTIQLAYYPPCHSKYNPVERAFGWLEQNWCGSLLDTVDTVLRLASSGTSTKIKPKCSPNWLYKKEIRPDSS